MAMKKLLVRRGCRLLTNRTPANWGSHDANTTGTNFQTPFSLQKAWNGLKARRLNRHSPDSGRLWGLVALFGGLDNDKSRMRACRRSNRSIDCAEAVIRADLPASRRSSAGVVCRTSDRAPLTRARVVPGAGRSATGSPGTSVAAPQAFFA